MLSDVTLAYGEELARALLGVDALYVAEQRGAESARESLPDRLVVLNMSTTHTPEPFPDYDAARASLTELRSHAASLPEPDRRRYYDQCCASTLALYPLAKRRAAVHRADRGLLARAHRPGERRRTG